MEERTLVAWEVDITTVRDMIFTVSIVARRDMRQRHAKFLGIISQRRKRIKKKEVNLINHVKLLSLLI